MFSPNMLKTFQSCSEKYRLKYIEKINPPQKAAYFEKGKKIHALANYYLRGDDISKLEKNLNNNELKIWEILKNNEYFQKNYVNSEYDLSCKIGEYWIGGRIDAIVKDENNFYILDYKTGSIPKNPEYDFQTIVYLLCLNSKLNMSQVQNKINFVYIDLKNKENHIIELTKEKMIEYEKNIIDICDKIETYQPSEDIEYSKKCEFCEFRKICT